MKENIKIAFVFTGTIIGAGLASGQEILQFFSLYGFKGFYGLILCCILYILICLIIINLCFKLNLKSYKEIIYNVLGKKLGIIVDMFLSFFIFGSNIIMLSGGGAMLNEYIGINKITGTLIMAIFVLTVSFFSTQGLIATNTLIVPLSTLSILLMGYHVLKSSTPIFQIHSFLRNTLPIRNSWILSTILYSSFNIMSAIGVLCPMTIEIKRKRSFIIGCILGSIILTIISLIINCSILLYYPESFNFEIPNLYIAKKFGIILPSLLTIVIWLEMFSTEISNVYSLCKRITYSFKIPYKISVLFIIISSIPFTLVGFTNLIRYLYPPFGAISFIFVFGCILKYFDIK
ncbi:transporter [Caloramator sp. E03]|uniref:YkvI family membrane protein n=1 Tax=Caloramator sp. E03 TaxID=2576307 RepID=UPI00110FFB80|nr:transporter [Caloramator sp. E03]QCX33729.1 transporter [Caloramator sp. E03]